MKNTKYSKIYLLWEDKTLKQANPYLDYHLEESQLRKIETRKVVSKNPSDIWNKKYGNFGLSLTKFGIGVEILVKETENSLKKIKFWVDYWERSLLKTIMLLYIRFFLEAQLFVLL